MQIVWLIGIRGEIHMYGLYGDEANLFDLFLERRGVTSSWYHDFDAHCGSKLARIDEMCSILDGIHERHEKIVVLPDFDCDGVMSGVVGYAGLLELGFEAGLFHPDPTKGYGFATDEVERLLREFPDVKWVITCDTGISEVEGTSRLAERGVRVLVTDHHREPSSRPVRRFAECVVDPCCDDETYALPGICGAHVLWQVLDHYARTYADADMVDQIWRLRVFAGIGTVSDLMPLVHENRQLVRDAVSISRMVWSNGDTWFFKNLAGCDMYRRAFYGLFCLLDAFSEARKLSAPIGIDEVFFGFYMAPAINALKRMGRTTDMAFDMFFGHNQPKSAAGLVRLNNERKALADQLFDMTLSVPQSMAPYIYLFQSQHKGMLGLVAGRIMEKTGMPTLVASIDPVKFTISGSGRSPEWFDCLSNCTSAGFKLAGHEHAFGFAARDIVELGKLFDHLDHEAPLALEKYEKDHADELNAPGYDILVDTSGGGDIGLDVEALWTFVDTQEMYRPFGASFEAPQFCVRFPWSAAQVSAVGDGHDHMRIVLPGGITLMCFYQAKDFPSTLRGTANFVGTIGINEFCGNRSLQFIGSCKFA